jgi:hypothetical protein
LTVGYIVAEVLGVEPLFKLPSNVELASPLNISEIVERLYDVFD